MHLQPSNILGVTAQALDLITRQAFGKMLPETGVSPRLQASRLLLVSSRTLVRSSAVKQNRVNSER
jgi:hypothetical protein